MLISDIVTQVRRNLDDLNITFFDNTRISDAVIEAYVQTTILSGSIEEEATLPVVAEKQYYDFALLFPNCYALVAIYHVELKKWLIPRSMRTLDIIRPDWEIWNGQPEYFCQINWRYVAIVPAPTIATGNLKIFYKSNPPRPVTVSYQVELPNVHITTVTDRATAECLEMCDEYGKAQDWWQSSFESFRKSRIATDSRALPDLMRGYSSITYGSNP